MTEQRRVFAIQAINRRFVPFDTGMHCLNALKDNFLFGFNVQSY